MVLKARDDKSQARVSTKAQPEAEKCTRPQFLNSSVRLRVASVLQRELTIQLHRQSKASRREALPFQVGDQFGRSEHRR